MLTNHTLIPRGRCAVVAMALTLAMGTVALAGCADDQTDSATPTVADDVTGTAGSDGGAQPQTTQPGMPGDSAVLRDSIRGDRYCEFLLVTPTAAGVRAEVYATFPLNDCPAEVWDAADTTEVAASAGVPVAIANGPRYWLIDSVSRETTSDVVRRELGGLDMNRYATVDIADLQLAQQRYTSQSVDRRAIMTYVAGSEVFVLVAPDGTEHVMQSFSQQVDAGLTEADLATLGDRLNLPDGWRFEARTLDADLVIDFGDQPARVLQDELQNSYSQIPVANES